VINFSARLSLVLSILVLAIKFFAYEMTKSTAVFSDAVESIVNVIAALVALFVMKAVAEPADEEHPYGHGKLEYFSAAFEGGLIAFAAIAIGIEAVRALIHEKVLRQPDIGLYVMGAAALINLLLGLHLRTVGRKFRSEALKASATHVLSDVWTSVGVMGGLAIVHVTGLAWIDPLVGVLIALQLGYSGYRIVRQSIGALIDEKEPKVLRELVASFNKAKKKWVIDIHQMKMIRSGRFHHIDAHMVVPEYWNVAETHEATTEFEKEVVSAYSFDAEIAFHVDPCEKKYCRTCEMLDCQIRQEPFEAVRPMSVETVVRGPLP